MANGSLKKRGPTGGGDVVNNAPNGSKGDDPLPLLPPARSTEGLRSERPHDKGDDATASNSGENNVGGCTDGTGGGGGDAAVGQMVRSDGVGGGAIDSGAPATVVARATSAPGARTIFASSETVAGPDDRDLPAAATTARLETLALSEDPVSSGRRDLDAWVASGEDGALRSEHTPLEPREGDDSPLEDVGCVVLDVEGSLRTADLAPSPSAAVAAEVAAVTALAAGGGEEEEEEEEAMETPHQPVALLEERRSGEEEISPGLATLEKPACVTTLLDTDTAREAVGEVGAQEPKEESGKQPAEAGTALGLTEAPPFDIGSDNPSALEELRPNMGADVPVPAVPPSTALSYSVLDEGLDGNNAAEVPVCSAKENSIPENHAPREKVVDEAAPEALEAAAAAAAAAASFLPLRPPFETSGVATTRGRALHAAEPDSPETPAETELPPPPPSAAVGGEDAVTPPVNRALADNATVSGGVCSERDGRGVESSREKPAKGPLEVAAVTKGVPLLINTATRAPEIADSSRREKATAAKAAAASATAAAKLASAEAAEMAEAAAAAVADAEAALEAIVAAEAEVGMGTNPAESVTPCMEASGSKGVATEAVLAGSDEAGERAVLGGDSAMVEPPLGSVESPGMPRSVEAATPLEAVLEAAAMPPTEEGRAGAAAAAQSDAVGDTVEEAEGEGGAAAKRSAGGGPASAPPAAATPSPFSEALDASESNAAAPAGATILSGSVSADVFSSRSGAGPCPWPSSSEDSDDEDGGFGGSSRNQMSVEEAAAFMNPGGAGTLRSGGGFASGSSWATTATSTIARVERSSGGGAAEGADGGTGGAFDSSSGGQSLGGASLGGSFVGTDDFLSSASIGIGGLGNSRRFSSHAAVVQSFSSSCGFAEDLRDLGARRSTLSEMAGRGARGNGETSASGGAVVTATAGEPELAAVVEGSAASGGNDSGTGRRGGVRRSSSAEPAAEEDSAPAAAQEAAPALLLRRGGDGGGEETEVVQAVHAEAAAQGANTTSTTTRAVVGEGKGAVKNPDGGDAFAANESAATSFAGGEGEAGSPSRGIDARGAVAGPRATAGGGGCCVVS